MQSVEYPFIAITLRSILTRSRSKSKVGNLSWGQPEGPIFINNYTEVYGVREGVTVFPGLIHFTLDPYLIMLSVKQSGIKYHFLSL